MSADLGRSRGGFKWYVKMLFSSNKLHAESCIPLILSPVLMIHRKSLPLVLLVQATNQPQSEVNKGPRNGSVGKRNRVEA